MLGCWGDVIFFFFVAFFFGDFGCDVLCFFLTFNKFNKILLGSFFSSRYLFVVFLGVADLFRCFFHVPRCSDDWRH